MGNFLNTEILNFSISLLSKAIDMTFMKKSMLFNIVQKEAYRKATESDDPSEILTVVSNDKVSLSSNEIKSDTVRFTTNVKSIYAVGTKVIHIDEVLMPKFDTIKALTNAELKGYQNYDPNVRKTVLTTNTLLIVDDTKMIFYNFNDDTFNDVNGGGSVTSGSGVNKWEALHEYKMDNVIISNNKFFIAKDDHISTDDFSNDLDHWESVGGEELKIKVNDVIIQKKADGYIELTIPTKVSQLKNDSKFVTESHNHNFAELLDTSFIDLKNEDMVCYDITSAKFVNKQFNFNGDKVKLLSSDEESKYLNELIGSTIEIKDGKLEATTLEGMTVTVANLNTLAGMTENIKKVLDGMSAGMEFRGAVNSYAIMESMVEKNNGDLIIVTSDETHDGKTYTYVYNENLKKFQPIGICTIEVRDFKTDPIDLTKEVKGKLPVANINTTGLALANDLKEYLKSSDAAKTYAKLTDLTGKVNTIDVATTFDVADSSKIAAANLTNDLDTRLKSVEQFVEEYNPDENTDKNVVYIYDDDKIPEKIDNGLTSLIITTTGKVFSTDGDGVPYELKFLHSFMGLDEISTIIQALITDTTDELDPNIHSIPTGYALGRIFKIMDGRYKAMIDAKNATMTSTNKQLIIDDLLKIIEEW